MDNYTISIFQNKVFFKIITEMKLFSDFKVKHYESLDFLINNVKVTQEILVFFIQNKNINILNKLPLINMPLILISGDSSIKKMFVNEFKDHLSIPFSVLEFKKKIILLSAKINFKKNSFIHLQDFIIDKNERKIKKKNVELQLSEKEINFLTLFVENKQPITRNLILKKVWNYSSESETHTIETHVHRLRKKIFERFGSDNLIKNNKKGYYI